MIKILADSTCDLSPELLKKYDIKIIPLSIVCGDKSYLDGIEINSEELFKWSDSTKQTPKTAAPGFPYVAEILKELMKDNNEIIFFGISEQMSTTCNIVRLVAKEFAYEKIAVINSMNLSTGIGLQVLRAAEMAQSGASLKEIVEEIESRREKVRASFVIDTLTYLHRGGRCTALAALVASTLNLKPKIKVSGGKMSVAKKYRGNINSVVNQYVLDMEKDLLNADEHRVFITHTMQDDAVVNEMFRYLKGLNKFEEILITKAGSVISSHCGPNTLGVLYYEK